MPPQVHGHHHLAIQVKDLPAAERFYRDVLGLSVLRRWPFEDGRPGERAVWLSVLPSGDADDDGNGNGNGDEFIALEACDQERPATPFRAPLAGLHLLALRILPTDRAGWEKKLAGLGVEIVHRTRYTLYFLDPEGNRLGLSHFPDEA